MIDFTLRISVFLVVFCLLFLWQWKRPRGHLYFHRKRWRHNFTLLILGALSVRLIQPVFLSFTAFLSQGFGLSYYLDLPFWAAFFMGVLLLDCLIYWQHRLFHYVPLFWRLHRVHHSDPELDVSSAVRFHPVEIILSLFIKAVAVWLFGIPIEAVLFFDILLNTSAMFNHTNVRLPPRVEFWLSRVIVTPDMHRIHHSRESKEANSNYGFFLSVWDVFFMSRTKQAQNGDEHLNIGMPETKTYQPKSFLDLLMMPVKSFKKQ